MNENVKYCPVCGEFGNLKPIDSLADTYRCDMCEHAFEIKEDKK